MKKNEHKNKPVTEDKPQTSSPTKKKNKGKYQPPEKTEATDAVINTAKREPGINQALIKQPKLLPSDQE